MTDWLPILHGNAGFPCCNRELALRRPNLNDPNNFYRMLGVKPWADERTIKAAGRALLRRYHPDGEEPNRDRFEELERAYRTLTDQKTRAAYDATPDGYVYVVDNTINLMFDALGDIEQVKAKLLTSPTFWSFYSYGPQECAGDTKLAQDWYDALIEASWNNGYHGIIVLVLSDVTVPFFAGERVCVPRIPPSPFAIQDLIRSRFVGAVA